MNSETEIEQPVPAPAAPVYSVPWKFMDNWISVILLIVVEVVIFFIMTQVPRIETFQNASILLLESAYILPVVLILAWRRVHWKHLGFGRFEWKTLGLGCGLLIAGYMIIIVHNVLLYVLGVGTQGEAIMEMFAALDSPVWLFIVGVIFAPVVEEIFFRGFLFQGFRQKYGWVAAMLVSSAIFAVGHLDPVALIPTFILGCVLAYVYHRSNSVWPGMILHFLVNAFGLCATYAAVYLQKIIPS